MRFILFVIVALLPFQAFSHAITYEYCAGRFGDKILGYAHARYLSFVTNIPFLYRPFENSQYLTIEYEALPFDQYAGSFSAVMHINSADTLKEFFRKIRDPQTPPTLFLVDYFAAEISEWERFNWGIAFSIPWREERFAEYLKRSLSPRVAIPMLRVSERLNVADHIRTLSGGDTHDTSVFTFPLKFPTLDYHERQIRRVYEWNLKRPMHVFLFSDTANPQQLLQQMRKRFKREDIVFNIQVLQDPDVNYVVQDFFAMQQFDVLITTQSNLSMMASRVGSFDMVISPVHATGQYPHCEIDRVQLVAKKSDWFPYELDVTLREKL